MPCFICITCGSEHAESEPAAGPLRDLRRRAAVRRAHGQQLDDDRGAGRDARGHAERGGAGAVERGDAADLRHRPARAAGACTRQGTSCGTACRWSIRPRVERSASLAAWPPSRSRIRTSTRRCVEWSRRSAACRSTSTRPTPRIVRRPDPCVDLLGRRHLPPGRRRDAGPHRRPLRRLGAAALGGRRRRPRRAPGVDTVKVGLDRQSVSVMRSYPNLIPVGPTALDQVEARLAPLAYDRIYGAWPGHHILEGAQGVVKESLRDRVEARGS